MATTLKLFSFLLIVSTLLSMQSCLLPGKGKNTIIFNLKNQPKKATFNPILASIDITNDIVTINGSGFSKVTTVKIQASGLDESFTIDSLSDSKIIASAKNALSLLVGSTFNLIISSAEASTTFPITFTLSDGVVTNTKLHSMGAQPGQVLQFNGTNWLPASFASPMNFIGMWDAGSGSPTAGAYSDGDYFIVSGAGSYGTDNYVVGDWAVYDGTDWNRVFTDAGTKLSKTGGTLTGDLILDTQAKFKGAANYVTLKASAGLASDITLTLPTSVGTNGQVLTTNGSGVLSWETVASSGGTGAVYSVNSQTGTVTLTTTDIAEGTNQYFTTARALSAVTASLATKQSVDTTLTALAAYNTNGILVQTAADTFVGRTLTGTVNRLTVTDGNGVGGNPTVDLDTTAFPSAGAGNAGQFFKATGANTASWTALVSSDVTTALGFTPINKAGDTISSGTFTFDTAAVLRTLDPVGLTDVANKQYVDAAVAALGTASNTWTASGTDIYRATGNVGIGLTNPAAPLHVVGTIKAEDYGTPPFIVARRANGTLGSPTAALDGDILGNLGFTGHTGSTFSGNAVAIKAIAGENFTPTVNGAKLAFYTTPLGSSTLAQVMLIDTNGNVGIGTSAPSASLTVNGEMRSLGSSNGYVGFKAAASTSSTTYTWPTSAGTNGYVLTTDGTGTLTWTAQTGGGSGAVSSVNSQTGTVTLTTTDIAEGTNEYFTTARAQSALTASLATKQNIDATLTALSGFNTNGILVQTAPDTFVGRALVGTANRITVTNGDGVSGSPTINLDTTAFPSAVAGNAGHFFKATGANTATWTALSLSDITSALGFTPLNKAGDTVSSGTIAIGAGAFLTVPAPVNPSDATNKTYVDSAMVSASTASNSWTASGSDVYRLSGNVGIGTASPGAPERLAINTSPGIGVRVGPVGNNGSAALFVSTASTSQGGLFVRGVASQTADLFSAQDSTGSSLVKITSSGNVGIGTTAPSASLTVNGEMRALGATSGYVGFKSAASSASTTYTWPTTSGTSSYVLSTDGAGILSWVAQSAGPANTDALTEGSTNLYFTAARAQSALTASLATKQNIDATLTALSGFNTNGILVQTAPDTFVGRALVGTANRITVTNGDGVSGSPTINLNTTLLPSPAGGDAGKFLKATGADASAWTSLASSDVTTALGFTPINKAGDTISGTLTFTSGNFTIGQSAFLIVPNPVLSTDAVNKGYVDSFGQWLINGSDIYRSSGKVGIGTAAPSVALDIEGTQQADTTYLKLGNTPAIATASKVAMEFWGNQGVNNGASYNVGQIYSKFDGNGYPYARLTLGSASGAGTFNDELNINNGKVGIGTATPGVTLDIEGTQQADTTYLKLGNTPAVATASKVAMEFWGNQGVNNGASYNMGRIYSKFDGNGYPFTRLTLGSASGAGTFNDELTIKNGSVGIGTATPTAVLHTSKTTASTSGFNTMAQLETISSGTVSGLFGPSLVFKGSNAGTGDSNNMASISSYSSWYGAGSTMAGVMQFNTYYGPGVQTVMSLFDSSGKGIVAIGTTSPASAKLNVRGNYNTNSVSNILYLDGDQPGSVATNGTNAQRVIYALGGKGGNTTGVTGQVAGVGGDYSITGGPGGNAPSGSTNGAGGGILLQGGTPGSGAGTAGAYGNITLQTSGGNVGIGVASPSSALHVRSSTPTILLFDSDVNAMDTSSMGKVAFGDGSEWASVESLRETGQDDTHSNLVFRTSNGGGSYNLERMRINHQGFVHMGSNNAGVVPPSDNTNGGLTVGWNRSAGSAEVNLYNSMDTYGTTKTAFIFSQKTASSTYADLMTLMGNGRVGIGTINPGYKFQVYIDASNEGHVDATGAWARTSDARFKKDILGLEDSLEKILSLKPVRYNSLSDKGENKVGKHMGFLAQDLEKVYPEVVGTDSSGRKSVSYDALIAPIIKAIKDLYHKWFDDSAAIHRSIASKADKVDVEKLKIENAILKSRVEKSEKENAEMKLRLERLEKASH